MPELTPTRSAYLELQEERIGMDEGYRFLDEKRLVLAAEILRQLERYEMMREGFTRLYREAAAALQGAVLRHGLDGLRTYPATATDWGDARRERRSVLGLEVQEVHVAEEESEGDGAGGQCFSGSRGNRREVRATYSPCREPCCHDRQSRQAA